MGFVLIMWYIFFFYIFQLQLFIFIRNTINYLFIVKIVMTSSKPPGVTVIPQWIGDVVVQLHLVLQQHHLPIFVKCGRLDNITYPLWHHNGCLLWRHYTIVLHQISWIEQSHLHLQSNILYIANFNKIVGWWFLTVTWFVSWIRFV